MTQRSLQIRRFKSEQRIATRRWKPPRNWADRATVALRFSYPSQTIYTLTDKGQSLKKLVAAVARWGEQHFPDTTRDPAEVMARKGKKS